MFILEEPTKEETYSDERYAELLQEDKDETMEDKVMKEYAESKQKKKAKTEKKEEEAGEQEDEEEEEEEEAGESALSLLEKTKETTQDKLSEGKPSMEEVPPSLKYYFIIG